MAYYGAHQIVFTHPPYHGHLVWLPCPGCGYWSEPQPATIPMVTHIYDGHLYFQYPREFVAFAPFPTAWAPPATMVVHHPVMQTPLPTRDEQSLPHAAAPPSKKIKQDYHTGRKRRFSDASSQTMMEMPVVKNEDMGHDANKLESAPNKGA